MQNIIAINSPEYPALLKTIGKNAPKQLYYKGKRDKSIFENCLAVVGSRRMTTYGKQITQKLVTQLAASGITIVSGFMYGIDVAAHRAAVEAGGRTIAVMPCGIDRVHPEYQTKLYDEILDAKGLIISEYEGDAMPAYWTYPARNRIVAGLSKAVLVIEAGEKSGSLITAHLAEKFKRKLFVVPGPLTSTLSAGICQLIREEYADVLTRAEDILEFFKISKSFIEAGSQHKLNFSGLENQIINQLKKEPMEIDNLARLIGLPVAEIGKTLSIMQLKNLLFEEGGKYFIKS